MLHIWMTIDGSYYGQRFGKVDVRSHLRPDHDRHKSQVHWMSRCLFLFWVLDLMIFLASSSTALSSAGTSYAQSFLLFQNFRKAHCNGYLPQPPTATRSSKLVSIFPSSANPTTSTIRCIDILASLTCVGSTSPVFRYLARVQDMTTCNAQ